MSPSTLLRLIRAPPDCYRIFKRLSAPVLAAIVLPAIDTVNLPLVLAICNYPPTLDWRSTQQVVPPHDESFKSTYESTQGMLGSFDYADKRLSVNAHDVSMLSRLCGLCDVVDSFIHKYASETLPLLLRKLDADWKTGQ